VTARDEALEALREGVRLAPRNLALRLHLAATLLQWNRPEEAEKEYRGALALAPGDFRPGLGLAKAFLALGKSGEAAVVVEALLKLDDPPAEARLLHARLLLMAGEEGRAARAYRAAVEADSALRDEAFERDLGLEREATGRDRPDPALAQGGGGEELPVERVKLDFRDVAGMADLKEEIRMKIVHPLRQPDLFRAYGKRIGGGILLYGPPGCGKTYLARATAGEVEAAFLPVGIHDVLDMYVGESERKLHARFEAARSNRPCVLFFDEVDALGASRSQFRNSATGRMVVNQFLSELDGVASDNEGVLVLAATNAPWNVDAAFRRPGRFDRVIFVPPPDAAARASILRRMLEGKPADGIDCDALAKRTEGFSSADLKGIVDAAVESRLAEAMRLGREMPITQKDLLSAAKRARPTVKEWFATAKNHALYANEGGIYDDILRYLRLA